MNCRFVTGAAYKIDFEQFQSPQTMNIHLPLPKLLDYSRAFTSTLDLILTNTADFSEQSNNLSNLLSIISPLLIYSCNQNSNTSNVKNLLSKLVLTSLQSLKDTRIAKEPNLDNKLQEPINTDIILVDPHQLDISSIIHEIKDLKFLITARESKLNATKTKTTCTAITTIPKAFKTMSRKNGNAHKVNNDLTYNDLLCYILSFINYFELPQLECVSYQFLHCIRNPQSITHINIDFLLNILEIDTDETNSDSEEESQKQNSKLRIKKQESTMQQRLNQIKHKYPQYRNYWLREHIANSYESGVGDVKPRKIRTLRQYAINVLKRIYNQFLPNSGTNRTIEIKDDTMSQFIHFSLYYLFGKDSKGDRLEQWFDNEYQKIFAWLPLSQSTISMLTESRFIRFKTDREYIYYYPQTEQNENINQNENSNGNNNDNDNRNLNLDPSDATEKEKKKQNDNYHQRIVIQDIHQLSAINLCLNNPEYDIDNIKAIKVDFNFIAPFFANSLYLWKNYDRLQANLTNIKSIFIHFLFLHQDPLSSFVIIALFLHRNIESMHINYQANHISNRKLIYNNLDNYDKKIPILTNLKHLQLDSTSCHSGTICNYGSKEFFKDGQTFCQALISKTCNLEYLEINDWYHSWIILNNDWIINNFKTLKHIRFEHVNDENNDNIMDFCHMKLYQRETYKPLLFMSNLIDIVKNEKANKNNQFANMNNGMLSETKLKVQKLKYWFENVLKQFEFYLFLCFMPLPNGEDQTFCGETEFKKCKENIDLIEEYIQIMVKIKYYLSKLNIQSSFTIQLQSQFLCENLGKFLCHRFHPAVTSQSDSLYNVLEIGNNFTYDPLQPTLTQWLK